MKVREITQFIEHLAPLSYQESYDNSGLIVGSYEMEVTGCLICLDSTEEVIEEAIERGCNMVIAHHPIVFSGLKKFNGKNYVERVVMLAIKNDIAIYAAHTNLDNIRGGVNTKIGSKLGLINTSILSAKRHLLSKLVTYSPVNNAATVRGALFDAGAGNIGEYSECSFSLEGEGSFKASDKANPYVGAKGERHYEKEVRVEVVFPQHMQRSVVKALLKAHPYEEVAYDIYQLQNEYQSVGSGLIGELEEPMHIDQFLPFVSDRLNTEMIRHTEIANNVVKRVGLCGGSGSFLLDKAIAAQADVYITGDFKYHEFFDAEKEIVIMDIGHFESEQFTSELFYEILNEKFPTFALHLSKINTNPINYYYGRD